MCTYNAMISCRSGRIFRRKFQRSRETRKTKAEMRKLKREINEEADIMGFFALRYFMRTSRFRMHELVNRLPIEC